MAEVSAIYPAQMLEDLSLSGLSPTDVRAKPLTATERQATGSPMGADGYVLPYYDLVGKALPHYRVKLFDQQVKYRQPAETKNHIYFPPKLWALLQQQTHKFVLITEG